MHRFTSKTCARVGILDACLLAVRARSHQEYVYALTHTRMYQYASMIETTMKWVARSKLHVIDFIEMNMCARKTHLMSSDVSFALGVRACTMYRHIW